MQKKIRDLQDGEEVKNSASPNLSIELGDLNIVIWLKIFLLVWQSLVTLA